MEGEFRFVLRPPRPPPPRDPLRFSLEEFGTITGLNCGAFPEWYEAPDPNQKVSKKQKGAHKDAMWKKLIGKYNNITIADLADELENDKEIDEWRRIRLALIIIVDGVLIASQQIHRPTPRYVKMLKDVDAFLEFPWGRESFLHTVRCMKPPKFEKGKPVEDPVGMLVQKLKQESFRLTGFPLALQLLAFKAILMLQSKIPAPFNELTIMELTEPNLPNHPSIELDSVLLVEHNPSLLVTPFIPIVRGPQPGWGVWPNVETDQKVAYMEQLIANNHRFTKSMWPGGDCSEPLFKVTPTPEEPSHKKHTVPRKRKERITRLFAASTSTPAPTNELLEDRVISLEVKVPLLEDKVTALETTVSTLRASNERLKARVNSLLIRKRKRSTAGSLLSQFVVKRRKSTPQTTQNNQDQKTDDCLLGSQSPILSQYQVHHHSGIERPISNPVSPDHQSHIHRTPEHRSQDPTTPANHQTPDHPSPEPYASPNHCPDDQQTQNPQSPTLSTSTKHSPDHHSSDHHSPDHDSPDKASNHQASDHHLPDPKTPVHESPDQLPKHTSHTQQPPADAFNATQGSPSQQYAPCSTLPQFDSTPLDKPTSRELMSPPHAALPIYDSLALPYSPPPSFSPLPDHTTRQGFSSHSSSPNAFAVTGVLKGDRSTFQSTPNSGADEGQISDNGERELNEESPDTTVRRVVDELNGTNTEHDVLHLSDSSPAKTTTPHSPSELEMSLHQALINRRDFPHYLLITSPPLDLWALFKETLLAKKNVFHVTPSKLDFSNQFLLDLATPRKWTDSLHMKVLMHMFGERHKDMLLMENASSTPPELTSLMQSKDRQFQAAINKDRIRWDPRLEKLILLPGKTWMKEVNRVYTPMKWGDRHWVGLVIDLVGGHVLLYDSLPSLYREAKVLRFLKPILQMLPYLIRYVAKDNSRDLSPFTWARITGVYENLRSGDCGPVCVKFMEMHLYSDPAPYMRGITDDNVDKFRQIYAMEAYKTIVLPAYPTPTSE
ncbi:hypothetical protein Bca101_025303 [Brassica carinata]